MTFSSPPLVRIWNLKDGRCMVYSGFLFSIISTVGLLYNQNQMTLLSCGDYPWSRLSVIIALSMKFRRDLSQTTSQVIYPYYYILSAHSVKHVAPLICRIVVFPDWPSLIGMRKGHSGTLHSHRNDPEWARGSFSEVSSLFWFDFD